MLDAQFVGFAQILVYTGAVVILILFGILLTRGTEPPTTSLLSPGWGLGLGVALLVFALLCSVVLSSRVVTRPTPNAPEVTVRQIGDQLMTRYILPLEVVGLLLTVALIGAVSSPCKKPKQSEAARTDSPMTPLGLYLLLSAMLFAVGLAGALVRRNAILVLIGIELMLNAANLNFIAFWRYGPNPQALTGVIFVLFLDRRGGSRSRGRLGSDYLDLSP